MRELARHTIFLTLAGSHAHGTARAGSDLDLRGVCIAPLELRLSLFERFEQHEGPLDPQLAARLGARLPTVAVPKTECVVYDVAKLLALCAAANPNALELLFADERDWLLATDAWRMIHDARRRFLTRKVQQTYLGYALAQGRRSRPTAVGWCIHRRASHRVRISGCPRPARCRPTIAIASSAGSPSGCARGASTISSMPKDLRIALQERVRLLWTDLLACEPVRVEAQQREVAISALGLPPATVAALEGERRYRAAMKHWESYERWKAERNPVRAELERRFGYDTKHAMHLVRLMRMGLEVLRTGELVVHRPDAAELLAIRDGALTFDALLELATGLQAQIRETPPHPDLRADVDPTQVDALLLALVAP